MIKVIANGTTCDGEVKGETFELLEELLKINIIIVDALAQDSSNDPGVLFSTMANALKGIADGEFVPVRDIVAIDLKNFKKEENK